MCIRDRYIIPAFFTIGDEHSAGIVFELLGQFDPDDPDMDPEVRAILDSLLPNFTIPQEENYILLPQYFGPWGDCDGDGAPNIAEYQYFGKDAYLSAATDPNQVPPAPPCSYAADFQIGGPAVMAALGDLPLSSAVVDLLPSWPVLDFENGDVWIDWVDGGQVGPEPGLGDGIPDRYQLALLAEVMCHYYVPTWEKYAWEAFGQQALDDFQANLVALEAGIAALPAGDVKTFWTTGAGGDHVALAAGLMGLSQDLNDAYGTLFGLDGIAVTLYGGGTPFSDVGDLDGDGDSNLEEYDEVVVTHGTNLEGYIRAALYNSPFWAGNPNLPAAGMVALGLLACACALGGASIIRRKR